jgi:HSP20 family molecular chaperone IbpA
MYTAKELFNFFEDLESVFEGTTKLATANLYQNNFPPTDVYIHDETKDIVFEMALAGVPKDHIHVSVEGDYMILELDKVDREREGFVRYQRGIKSTSCKQKFFVHSGKYDLSGIKVSYKEGLLIVNIPAKESQRKKEVKIS